MKRFIFGVILGSFLITGVSYAYRIPRPLRITDFDQKNLVILNETLEALWDLTNGRYNLSLTTVNPDGAVKGNAGDMILFNNSGTYYLEICVGGIVWRGEELSNTP